MKTFEGTLGEALTQSAKINKKVLEALTRTEKSDVMWRMVCTSSNGNGVWSHSKKDMVAMGFVASNTISRMRNVHKAILKSHIIKWINPMDMSWVEAQERVQSQKEPDGYTFDQQEALVRDWADRLGKTFKDAPTKNPDAFLLALEEYSPQMM